MKQTPRAAGFSLIELLVVLLIVAVLAAIALPAIGKARQTSGVEQSLANLVTLGVAHVLYAADWNGRQVTWAVDDLGLYGNVQNYCAAHGGCEYYDDPSCHPPVLVGWGCNDDGDCRLYAFRPCLRRQHDWVVEPIGFPGCGNAGIEGAGHFRYPTAKAFHDYVNGRWYDPTFYAPNDSVPYTLAATLFDEPWDYSPVANPPYLSSYSFSAAAMFDPDVMRSNAAGGWQCAWDLDYGFRSPGLFQAQYPDLKTQIIEHHWVQGPPAECNPNPPPDLGSYEGCTPYYFNHGIDSTPVTLFYDGHVRLLPNTEVFAADQQILKQTGGVDGLWHRRTPFGVDGYYISYGYDGAPLSHHILTTDGILGRDTLGGMPPMPVDGPRQWAPQKPRPFRSTGLANHQLNITLTTEGNEP